MLPETLLHDLENGLFEISKLVLIIFNEAYLASGSHIYCQIIRKLSQLNFGYRILALSQMPGGSLCKIQEVILNLRITKLELKDKKDPDLLIYAKQSSIQTIIIKGGDAQSQISRLIEMLINKSIHILRQYLTLHDRYNVVRYPN